MVLGEKSLLLLKMLLIHLHFTMLAWVRTDQMSTIQVAFSVGNSGATSDLWGIGIYSDGKAFMQATDGTPVRSLSASTLTSNTWHCIVGVENVTHK